MGHRHARDAVARRREYFIYFRLRAQRTTQAVCKEETHESAASLTARTIAAAGYAPSRLLDFT
jgi:hypothetical protein